jgi:hypothetical protein
MRYELTKSRIDDGALEMNIRKAALLGASAQILWSLVLVFPQLFGFNETGLNAITAFTLFPSAAIAIFLVVAFWKHDQLYSPIYVRMAALLAALCLAIENLPLAYETIRGFIWLSENTPGWQYHLLQMRCLLAPTIPIMTVICTVAFLIVMYGASLGFDQLAQVPPTPTDRTAKNAALPAFIANLLALAQLLLFVDPGSIRQIPGFPNRFTLRAMSSPR